MSTVTLRKPGSPKASFVSVEIKANGDVFLSRWKDGSKAAKGTNFPAASFAPATAQDRRDAIVKEEAANGYVMQSADFPSTAPIYSFALRVPHDATPHVLSVFEAFGITVSLPTSNAPHGVVGTEFTLANTVNGIRITAALSVDPSDSVQISELHRHLAIARCLATDAEVFENTNVQVDPLDTIKRVRNDLGEAILEPLYRFGVLRRPMDLSREFTDASTTPFAVGF